MKLFKLLTLALMFLSTTNVDPLKSIPSKGFVIIRYNYFLSEKPTPEGAWEDYQLDLTERHISLIGTYPDTSILHVGEKYYNNPKYMSAPLVGVSKVQFIAFCKWRSDYFNKLKNYWPPWCSNKYWRQIHKGDPNNEYKIEFFIPAYKDVKDVAFLDCKYRTMFSDTIVGEPNPAFNNDSAYTFYTAARYVKR